MNTKKTYTVTIGIPAHNEEANIGLLVKELLKQNLHGLNLKKVIVASDNSTDTTCEIVSDLGKVYPKVKLIKSVKRLGKPGQINKIFSHSNTDFVVILDADVTVASNDALYNLILPMIEDTGISLTSGISIPNSPQNFAQRVAFAGFTFWDYSRFITVNSELYYCEGPIRAFRKDLYEKIAFPPTIAEDVYPYLYAMENGFKFKRALSAQIEYKLPSTLTDYVKQMTRAIKTVGAQEKYFSRKTISKYYTIGPKSKIISFIHCFNEYPIEMLFYVGLLGLPKIKSLFLIPMDSGVWNVVLSTKKV